MRRRGDHDDVVPPFAGVAELEGNRRDYVREIAEATASTLFIAVVLGIPIGFAARLGWALLRVGWRLAGVVG